MSDQPFADQQRLRPVEPVGLEALLGAGRPSALSFKALLEAREQAGFKAGWEAGAAAAETSVAAREQALAAAKEAHIAEAEADREATAAMIAALELAFVEALAPLALDIAGAVLEAEPSIASTTLAAMVGDLIAASPASAGTKLHASPDIANRLTPLLPEGWVLVVDQELPAGSLVAHVAMGSVATGVTQRLAQLTRHLAEEIPDGSSPAETLP